MQAAFNRLGIKAREDSIWKNFRVVDNGNLLVLFQPFGYLVVSDDEDVVNPWHIHFYASDAVFEFVYLYVAAIQAAFRMYVALLHALLPLLSEICIISVASQIYKVNIHLFA